MTRYRNSLWTVLLTGIGAIAASFAVAGPTPTFVLAPITDAVVAATPGQVITLSILLLGSLGSTLGFLLAASIGVALFGGTVAALDWYITRATAARAAIPRLSVVGIGGALLVAGEGFLLTGAPLSASAAGIGAGVATVLATRFVHESATPNPEDRRQFLKGIGFAAGIGGLGFLAGREAGKAARPTADQVFGPRTGDGTSVQEEIEGSLASASAQSFDVAGLPPLVSRIGDFYEVDINSIDPDVDAASWSLSVTGAVTEEVTITYQDLLDREPENRFNTLRCVGEALNGHKMDTALWTGVPIEPLLDAAGPQGEYVMLRAADGYFEEFPLAALRTGFLAYGMNGEVLPRGHGYPVRALIPGHWGEINVKWVTEIEILTQEMDGFWESRGWHGTGPVNTVAKLWADNRLQDGRVEVAGHAYAGTRGIERVEVSTDGGATWADAELGPKLPGTDVWRQWRYVFDPSGSSAEVVVRATDGRGDRQPEEQAQPYPSGATGWVSKTLQFG